MKKTILGILGATALFAVACSSGSPNDVLTGSASDPAFRPGTQSIGVQHVAEAESPLAAQSGTAPYQGIKIESQSFPAGTPIPSPLQAAVLHSAAKIPYGSLGNLLASRGVKTANKTTGSAGQIYTSATISYGVAQYAVRLPETIIASTAAIAKLYDLYAAAAQEVQADGGAALSASTGCSGVALFDANGQFTQNGISCLIGRTAPSEYVTISNTAISDVVSGGGTMDQGQQIAIAALLSAAQAWE
jgi:hypothetical protein